MMGSNEILCVDNSGFEDHLTYGQDYHVLEVGDNGYLIECDNGKERWMGAVHFAFM